MFPFIIQNDVRWVAADIQQPLTSTLKHRLTTELKRIPRARLLASGGSRESDRASDPVPTNPSPPLHLRTTTCALATHLTHTHTRTHTYSSWRSSVNFVRTSGLPIYLEFTVICFKMAFRRSVKVMCEK